MKKGVKVWGLIVILMVVISCFSWAAGSDEAGSYKINAYIEQDRSSLNATKPNEVTNLSWVNHIHDEIHSDINLNENVIDVGDVTYDNASIIRKSDVTPLDANNNRIEDSLELRVSNVRVPKVDVIVLYNRSVDLTAIDYSPIGAEIKYEYSVINATAITIPCNGLYELPKIQNVKMVYEDHEVQAYLDSSVPVIKADTARTTYNVTGSNVTIAVIDTGIDDAHESLDDMDDNPATTDPKVIGFKDFVNLYADPYDDYGHGTHCAGIAAGTGGSSVYKGVAPGAKLVGIKVLNAWGSGSESTVIAGIDWAVQNKDDYGIKIISMSLGRDYNNDGTTPMALACDAAVDAGIVVSVAAGNAGIWGSKTVGDPACAKKVITVGAIDDDMDIAYFSSRGPTADGRTKPEVCAVGVDVMSAEADTGSGYVPHGGTSMSTPHVAGIAALMLEYNPNLAPLEVKEILMDTAVDRGVIGPDNDYGWGVADAMFALLLSVPQEHDFKVSLPFIPEYREINKSIPINATVFNKGLNNETNVIIDFLVDGTILDSKTIPFIQNGTDTTISFNWTPTAVGWYNVSVYAIPVPGEDYVVNNLATRYVEVPKAVLTDVYADYGIDLDGDGLYNYLAVDVGVNVAEAGYYYLYGDIETLNGFYITDAKNDTHLSVGKQNITLLFNGMDIRRIDLNGPYTLSNLRFRDNYWNTLDWRLKAYNTSFYDSRGFQLPNAMFIDVYNDTGVDTDNDGYYNYLSLDIGVNVSESGYYHWYGELYDGYGDRIAYEGNSTYLENGTHRIQLDFKGPEIYMHKVDGPYYLKYLRIYDADYVKQDSRHDAYTTSAYNYMEFRPPAIFTDEYSDYGEDTDVPHDGQYNHLVINVSVNVTKAGRYQVSGSLRESTTYRTVAYAYNTTNLTTGDQIVQLRFDGIKLRQNKYNGTYDLKYLYLYNYSYPAPPPPPTPTPVPASQLEKSEAPEDTNNFGVLYGEQLDYRYYAYTTGYYEWPGWQKPPAEFTDIYSDYGEDTDGDGLNNSLVIVVGVNVTKAGTYKVRGELYENATYYYVISDYNTTYLDTGYHNVLLKFDGIRMRLNKYNGTYDLRYLYLYNMTYPYALDLEEKIARGGISPENVSGLYGEQLDYRYYACTTGYYNWTEFQKPPAEFTGNFNDYGFDIEGEGLYNHLVIEAEINVTRAGEYELSGDLRYYDEDSAPAEKSVKVSATTPPAGGGGGGGGGGAPPALIDWDSNRTYLDAGIQNITLQFDRVYNTGYNGSFRTWLRLYETEEWIEIDEAEYFTKNYNYTDFQKPPAGSVSVTRDLPDAVSSGEEFEVSLTQSGFYFTGYVIEKLPDGFKYRGVLSGGELREYDETTNELTIGFDGGATTLIYRVEAGTKEQIETAEFSGTWASVDSSLDPIYGDIGGEATLAFVEPTPTPVFDTGTGTYPSISGTHNGTIKPNKTITVSKLYTYPCAGTGGHTEYARIWNNSGLNATANWNGYKGDWHTITFNKTFVLYKNKTYNYTIRTGSYPQIIHKQNHTTLDDGSLITCEEFTDVNGKKYDDWIPAIKLFF
ncbi:MAG: S8 family serine peptidase [Halobacteriota archaeon]